MNWPTRRLRHQVVINPPVPSLSMPGPDVPFLAMDSIGEDGSVDLSTVRPRTELGSYTPFADDDVVFAKVTPCFENGKRAHLRGLAGGAGYGTTELTVLRAKDGMHPRFLAYLIQEEGFRHGAIAAMTGAGGLRRVPDSYVRDFAFEVPPENEQQRIAAYLDQETGKIAELIAKQEQLLTTLAERRQAAMTARVSPQPGWVRTRLKRLITERYTGTSVNAVDQPAEFGQPAVLKTSSVSSGTFIATASKAVVDDLERSRLVGLVRSGTILVNRANSPTLVGSAAVVRNSPANLYLSDKIWSLRVSADVEFIGYWLQTPLYRDQVGFHTVGASSSMQNLAFDDFADITIALPSSRSEQHRIAESVASSLSGLERLTGGAREMITLLQERRQALISAAVTGKIDVGGE